MSRPEDHPYFVFKYPEYNFERFHIVIAICTLIAAVLFILNIVLGCCSRYSEYWNDPHTGNRWIVSLWTATPHKQPPLDYTELQTVSVPRTQVVYETHVPEERQTQVVYEARNPEERQEQYLELKKRESEI